MRKLNLNKKGFTLIELLAVIVILAIIIMLVFPQITNVMNSSKVSLIHSKAKELSKWWDTTTSADELMVSSSEWTIPAKLREFITGEGVTVEGTKKGGVGNWVCIGDVKATDDEGKNISLAEIMEITDTEFKLTGVITNLPSGDVPSNGVVPQLTNANCSAIRYRANEGIDILLVAKSGGRQYVAGKTTYAFSSATGGVSQ